MQFTFFPIHTYNYISGEMSLIDSLILLIIGIIAVFFGTKLWKFFTVIIGAAFGYFIYVDFLFRYVPSDYRLIGLILSIIIFALIAGVIARIALSFLLSLAALSVIAVFLSLIFGILIFLIAFIIFYIFYKKIIILISAFAGSAIIFISLLSLKAGLIISSMISLILLILGLIYQLKNKNGERVYDRETERV